MRAVEKGKKLAKQHGKLLIVEETGFQGTNKAAEIAALTKSLRSADVPFFYWQIASVGKGAEDFEVRFAHVAPVSPPTTPVAPAVLCPLSVSDDLCRYRLANATVRSSRGSHADSRSLARAHGRLVPVELFRVRVWHTQVWLLAQVICQAAWAVIRSSGVFVRAFGCATARRC